MHTVIKSSAIEINEKHLEANTKKKTSTSSCDVGGDVPDLYQESPDKWK